jgi:hypothetical protein
MGKHTILKHDILCKHLQRRIANNDNDTSALRDALDSQWPMANQPPPPPTSSGAPKIRIRVKPVAAGTEEATVPGAAGQRALAVDLAARPGGRSARSPAPSTGTQPSPQGPSASPALDAEYALVDDDVVSVVGLPVARKRGRNIAVVLDDDDDDDDGKADNKNGAPSSVPGAAATAPRGIGAKAAPSPLAGPEPQAGSAPVVKVRSRQVVSMDTAGDGGGTRDSAGGGRTAARSGAPAAAGRERRRFKAGARGTTPQFGQEQRPHDPDDLEVRGFLKGGGERK